MTISDAELQFDSALEFLKSSQLEQARRAFEAALRLHPCPPAPWHYQLGKTCESQKDWQAAREAYLGALASHSKNAVLHFRLGYVEEQLENPQAAEQAYRQALAIDASQPDWHGRLALFLKSQGRLREAVQALHKALPLYALKVRQGHADLTVNWAHALHECRFHEEGLSVLMRKAELATATARFESVLFSLTDALGAKGRIASALGALEKLGAIQQFRPMALRQYLKLCVKYAWFEDGALQAAEQARGPGCTDLPTKEAALLLTFLHAGSSLALVEEALDLIGRQDKPNRSLTLHTASMLFRLGEYERLQALCRAHPDLWSNHGETPAISHFIAHAQDAGITPEQRALARETLAAYDAVQQAEKDIWGKIADTRLSLAIVGNSSCEKGRGRADEIDSHDIVIRFNNFSLEPPHDKDYGQKVDMIVRVAADKPQYEIKQPARDIVISAIYPLDRYNSWSMIRRLIAQGHRVCFYPQKLQQQLIHALRRSPSAGLTTTWIAHHLRGRAGKTSYYGFSFLDQTGPNAQSAHYFEASLPSARHEWEKEARIFQRITGRDMHIPAIAPPPKGPRIRLLGDHSGEHAGCAAVTDYLVSEIETIGTLCSDDNYDILVVNGEGSMHHDSRNFKEKMAAMGQALGRGKRACLINTVWQSNGAEHDHILQALDGIVVREQMSHDDLLKNHGIDSAISLDVSYWAPVREDAPFRDLQGAAVVGDFYSREFATFVRLTGGSLKSWPFIGMSDLTWSGLVKTLRTASLLVTGRHHGVLAACRARTPFVALQGNTHQIEGMIRMSGLPIPVCTAPGELDQCIRWARGNTAVYEEFFAWMAAQPRFRLGELLGIAPSPPIGAENTAPHREAHPSPLAPA